MVCLPFRSCDRSKKFNIWQINHNNIFISTMKPLSAQCNNILSLLDSGHSDRQISSITSIHHSTISRLHKKYCPNAQKSSGGHPSKLTSANTCFAIHLITSQKAENAMQVTKTLQEVTNQPLSDQTTCCYLKRAGMKAVKKVKKPLLSQRHKRERLDFAIAHQPQPEMGRFG